MRCITVLALCIAVAGCAQKPAGPPPKVDSPAACYSKPQCDAMWAEAMVQAQNLSGMRIQTATDSFLQTFNPTDFRRMGAMARKMPQANGSTVIEASFNCRACGNLAYAAVNLFTTKVKLAGVSFGPVEIQGATPAGGAPVAPYVPAAPAAQQPLDKQAWQSQQLKKLQDSNVSYEEYQRRYREITGE